MVSCIVAYFQNQYTMMLIVAVMILRVWAMYSRSRLVLGTLLASFSVEIIATTLPAAFYSDPQYLGGM